MLGKRASSHRKTIYVHKTICVNTGHERCEIDGSERALSGRPLGKRGLALLARGLPKRAPMLLVCAE